MACDDGQNATCQIATMSIMFPRTYYTSSTPQKLMKGRLLIRKDVIRLLMVRMPYPIVENCPIWGRTRPCAFSYIFLDNYPFIDLFRPCILQAYCHSFSMNLDKLCITSLHIMNKNE
jgi:hypothetical protein